MQEGLKLWPGGVSGGLAYQGLPGPTTAYQDLPSGFWRWEFPGRRRKEMIRSSIKMRITIKIIGKERPPPSGGWRRQPVRNPSEDVSTRKAATALLPFSVAGGSACG